MFSRWSDSSQKQFLYLIENSKTCNNLSITLKFSNSEKFGSHKVEKLSIRSAPVSDLKKNNEEDTWEGKGQRQELKT